MREEYDFSDAKKHPLAGKFNGKFTAIVHYDLNSVDENYDEELDEKLDEKLDVESLVVAEDAGSYSSIKKGGTSVKTSLSRSPP